MQKWPFFQVSLLGNIDQINVSYDILELKERLSRLKKQQVQRSENWDFSKGVNPWFWSNNRHFSNFFLGNIAQKNVLYDILGKKTVFLDYENNKFKKVEKLRFLQRG